MKEVMGKDAKQQSTVSLDSNSPSDEKSFNLEQFSQFTETHVNNEIKNAYDFEITTDTISEIRK